MCSSDLCAGVAEPVRAYRLPEGVGLELVGGDGRAVRRLEGVTLFVKDTPAAARSCGGIGTWERPAAQLGASVFNAGTLVVDPFAQQVWFRPPPAGKPARERCSHSHTIRSGRCSRHTTGS